MISKKIVITNFSKKKNNENYHLYFLIKFGSWKMLTRILESSQFGLIRFASFKILNPDSLGVKNKKLKARFQPVSSKWRQSWFY